MRRAWSWLTAWWRRGQACISGEKSRPELLARLSHEMRTSLTGIIGYAEFLEAGTAEPMMNFTAKIIRESGLNLVRSSNSYIDLQYLQRGELRLTCKRFLLSDVVRDVATRNHKKALERDVRLVLNCSEAAQSTWINTDRDRLTQALDALVFHAVEASEKWHVIRLELSVGERHDCLLLSIETAYDPRDQSQSDLVAEFWRDDDYRFRLQQGPGVELALAKALLQSLGVKAAYQTCLGSPTQLLLQFAC